MALLNEGDEMGRTFQTDTDSLVLQLKEESWNVEEEIERRDEMD